MARPTRQGVDYFPLDVYLDNKVKFIEIKFGLKGFGTVVKILQNIYSQGYWSNWGEDEKLLFADENRITLDEVKDITGECLDRGIFDKKLYDTHKILTSTGIQKRYKEIVRRRKDVDVTEDYLLIDSIAAVNADMVTTSCRHGDGKSTQSKVKESKVKESTKEHIELFEYLWSLYPRKRGKGQVSDSQKKKLHEIGKGRLEFCIDKFIKEMKKEKREIEKYPYGSTFFNSGYIDYLGENEEKKKSPPLKMIMYNRDTGERLE